MLSALGESDEYKDLLRRFGDALYDCGARTSDQVVLWLAGRNRGHDYSNVGVMGGFHRPRGIGRMGISRSSQSRLNALI
jgi:hypothetical protein